jgi:hypothetical protein
MLLGISISFTRYFVGDYLFHDIKMAITEARTILKKWGALT